MRLRPHRRRGALERAVYTAAFGEVHPYRWIVERRDDVEAVRLRHAQWFLQRYYAPDNATLVVVGGFDPGLVRASIERLFANVVRSAPRPEPEPVPRLAPLSGERRLEMGIPAGRDRLIVAWPSPARFDEGDAELEPFEAICKLAKALKVVTLVVPSSLPVPWNDIPAAVLLPR